MELVHIAPGLARWEIAHPAWKPDPEPGSTADWPEVVGCTAAMVGGRAVFIDPLLPPEPDDLWPALDDFAGGAPVTVLTTIRWHGRSRRDFVQRFEATTEIPPGVVAIPVPDETMFWLPDHATLVTGDRLIGDGEGGVTMCPESWLRYIEADPPVGHDDVRAALLTVLDLPVERVLVSHGTPVLDDGWEHLARALAA